MSNWYFQVILTADSHDAFIAVLEDEPLIKIEQ